MDNFALLLKFTLQLVQSHVLGKYLWMFKHDRNFTTFGVGSVLLGTKFPFINI